MCSINIGVLLLLLGNIAGIVSATDCVCTPAYDKTASDGDGDCSVLKTYIACIETKVKAAACDVPTATQVLIKAKTGCTAPQDTCLCQIAYWGTDLTATNEPCTALGTYKTCLDAAKTATGCGTETLVALKAFVTGHENTNTCSTPAGPTSTDNPQNGSPTPKNSTVSDNPQNGSPTPKNSTGARTVEIPGLVILPLLTILKSMLM